MLPVARPQHVDDYHLRDDYQGPVDPVEAALGDFQDMQPREAYQQQADNSMYYGAYNQATPGGAGQQPPSSAPVDLEEFKLQKIQEFRRALDFEIEQKRQQAQKDLQTAEREKWQQLMEFQNAIQGEMTQVRQQHVAQASNPLHQQQSAMPAASRRTLPQHDMLAASDQQTSMGGTPEAMHYHGLPQNSLGNQPTSVLRGSGQQHQRGRPPIQQHVQHGMSAPGSRMASNHPIQQHPQNGMNIEGAAVHQQFMQLPANRLSTQASPRNSSPGRQPNLASSGGYMQQTQQSGMMKTSSPLRQRDDAMHAQGGGLRAGSPSRQQQQNSEPSSGLGPQQAMGLPRTSTRQFQSMAPVSIQEQIIPSRSRSTSPVRPTQGTGTSGYYQHDASRTTSPLRHEDYGAADDSMYRQGMTRTSSPMRQEDYGASEESMYRHGMGRAASPLRQREFGASQDSIYHQSTTTTATQARTLGHTSLPETSMRYHQQGMARTASPMRQQEEYGPWSEPSPRHHHHQRGMARIASPLRQPEYGTARAGSTAQERAMVQGSSLPQHDEDDMLYSDARIRQRYHDERSLSPPQSRLPPASPYHESQRRRSPSRSPSPPRHRYEESARHMSPSQRPPTTREMQEHFQQYRDRRRGRDDIWRARDHRDRFTFDRYGQYEDEDTYDFSKRGALASQSTGVDRSFPQHRSRERLHLTSTWTPRDTSPSRRDDIQHQLQLDEAEELEREYAKLTGKSSPSKASALLNVKRMQEARRKKLEDLTSRVVQNRRRLAHEMQTADRPLEISFVDKLAAEMDDREHPNEIYLDDAREERQAARSPRNEKRESKSAHHHRGEAKESKVPHNKHRKGTKESKHSRSHHRQTRDSRKSPSRKRDTKDSKRKNLAVVKEIDELSQTEEGSGSMGDEGATSNSEQYGDGVSETSSGKESTSQEKYDSSEEGVSQGDQIEYYPVIEKPKAVESGKSKHKTNDAKEKLKKGKSSKSKEPKGEIKAKDFVDRLRERRSYAKEALSSSEAVPPTYKREDVLTSLEKGKSNVTLPNRDPKLARKNRKKASQKLVESPRSKVDEKRQDRSSSRGRSVKIAIKKSSSSHTEMRSNTKHPERNVDTKLETKQRYAPVTDNPVARQVEEQVPKTKASHNKEPDARVSSKTPKSKKNEIGDIIESQRARSKKSPRPSSGISTISDLSESAYGVASYTGSGVNFVEKNKEKYDEEGTDDGADSESGVLAGSNDSDDDASSISDDLNEDGKKKMIKVRELKPNSVAEGFEVEEGFDLQSIISAYSKRAAEDPEIREDTYEETLKGLKALQELETRLDERERRSVMPELLELTELHGWDIQKVVKHFVRFFPQVVQGVRVDELTWGHFMQLPVKEIKAPAPTSPSQRPPSRNGLESGRNRVTKSPHQPGVSPMSPTSAPPLASPVTSPLSPVSPLTTPSTREFTLIGNPGDDMFTMAMPQMEGGSDSGSGWRSRIRSGFSHPKSPSPAAAHESSIDMDDVRSSLENISKRHRQRAGRSYRPRLRRLEERRQDI